MKKIDLSEINLQPQATEIDLGNDIVLQLRPYVTDDASWALKKFGGQEGIEKLFTNTDLTGLCQIVYRLLPDEQKEIFCAEEVDSYDDDGNKIRVKMTGPERLHKVIKRTNELKLAFIKGLVTTIGLSMPLIEELSKQAMAENQKEKKKKVKFAGRKSTTSSRRNTGTRSRKSGK